MMDPALIQSSSVPPWMDRLQRLALLAGTAGLALCAVGAISNPQQFFRSYLVSFVFWAGLTLGCLAIIMLHHLTGGAWGLVIRRLLESGTRTLPLVAGLFVPLAFGLPYLYIWAQPEAVAADPMLQLKQPYLNVPFFLARTAVYFAAWIGLAHFLNKWSQAQDQATHPPPAHWFRMLSAPGLIVYGFTVTFASIDWVMSIDPFWVSTIFGVLVMGGQVLSALAFVIAALFLLSHQRPIAEVISPGHFHDLGKLLLAFVMLWAYFAYSQYLLIWSGNLPEEIPWYLSRLQGGWGLVGLLIVVGHFALPFMLLLSRDAKRNGRVLAAIAGVIIVMHLVDLFWLITPGFQPAGASPHWMDLAASAGIGGLWLAYFIWQLRGRALLPLNDAGFHGVQISAAR